MAYTTHYQAGFNDNNGVGWDIYIQKDAAAPDDIMMLKCTGNPLGFEWNSSDDVFNTIHDSQASLTVYSETQFALQALYAIEDREFKVVIYESENTTLKTWSNHPGSPYPTFTSLSINDLYVLDTANSSGVAYTNKFSVNIGDTIRVSFNINLIAGETPIHVYTDGVDTYSHVVTNGYNEYLITSDKVSSNCSFSFSNYDSTEYNITGFNVLVNHHLYWTGYINSNDYAEPYDMPPYPVTIKASCGLSSLENIPFDNNGILYDGRRFYSQIIIDILAKIGYVGFTEYVNIYETGMVSTVDDSPFDQVSVDVDIFDGMYCDEVLRELLKPFNAVITHKGDEHIIYRPTELTSQVHGRIFTEATTKTSTSINDLQYINRSTHITTKLQVEGGSLMPQTPASKVTIYQDYGDKESWIENWKVEGNTYYKPNFSFRSWINVGGNFEPAWHGLPGERDGMLKAAQSSVFLNYVYQSFGTNLVATSNVIGFSVDFYFKNLDSTDIQSATIYLTIKSDTTNNWLYEIDRETLGWRNTPSDFPIIMHIEPGDSGWQTYTRSITSGLPADGSYTFTFYNPYESHSTNFFAGIKNIKIYSTSDSIEVKRKKHSGPFRWLALKILGHKSRVTNYIDNDEIVEKSFSIKNSIVGKEIEEAYILGDVSDTIIDNVLEQFGGSLSVNNGLASGAAAFVTAHAAAYTAGGVIVTCSSSRIIFTSDTASVPFSGSTTITTTSPDLSGTVIHTQANVIGSKQVDKILLTGVNGYCDIGTDLGYKEMDFQTTLSDTVDYYISEHGAALLGVNHVVATKEISGSDVYLVFTAADEGFEFTTYINRTGGTLDGEVTTTSFPLTPMKQIDTVVLNGTSGSANILCDGVTRSVSVGSVILTYSTTWNTRGGSENKPLLNIIGDEIAFQYSRPKHLIQMPIQDTGNAVSSVNILGSFQDDLNKYSSNNRKFVFNRGSFDVKNRRWNIDFMEII